MIILLMENSEKIERIIKLNSLELPKNVLENIIIVFKDGDENNWDISNVTYVFSEPQKCPFYNGYYYIAGYSRYVINKDGKILNIKTGINKKWSMGKVNKQKNIKGGYFVTWARADDGRRFHISRHRAICLAFKRILVHPGKLMINHIDGIPGNDSLDNLEWCTSSDNVKHAYDSGLYPNKCRKIVSLNWISGKSKTYNTIQEASEDLNIKYSSIYSRLSKDNGIKYKDGWRFKDIKDEWLELKDYVGQCKNHVNILARNVFTDRIFVFNTINEASRILNIKSGSIREQCINEVMHPLKEYNFRFLENFEGWPKYTKKHLEIFKTQPIYPSDGVEVYDIEKNEHLFFKTKKECAEYFSISPITVSKLACYEGIRDKRYKFKTFRINNVEIGPITEKFVIEKISN